MILILLPDDGFDPTEASVPWKLLTDHGYEVQFATPTGLSSRADERVVSLGFGPLSPFLMTRKKVLKVYKEMIASAQFQHPFSFKDVDPGKIDCLIIPGGHGEKMRPFLESETAQNIVQQCWVSGALIAAICTGVLLLARTKKDNQSIIHDYKVTSVTHVMEWLGWLVTFPWLKNYFRIYPIAAEQEIKSCLDDPSNYQSCWWRCLPFYFEKLRFLQFTVEDRSLITARWPGDCYRFSQSVLKNLKKKENNLLSANSKRLREK